MTDKAKAAVEQIQALLRQHSVEAIEAVGPFGNNQFRIRYGGADDLILIQFGPGIQMWTPTNQDGRVELNARQQPFADGLRSVLSSAGVNTIQSIAVRKEHQGIAFGFTCNDPADNAEIASITQSDYTEPDPSAQ